MKRETNTNLAVDYKEKDSVKALGARWRPEEKVWYVPAGLDLEPFSRWLPDTLATNLDAEETKPSTLPPASNKEIPLSRKRRKLYNPKDPAPFAVSRSKIDLFVECQRYAGPDDSERNRVFLHVRPAK